MVALISFSFGASSHWEDSTLRISVDTRALDCAKPTKLMRSPFWVMLRR